MFSIYKSSRWFIAVFISLFASLAFGHGMSEAEKQIIIEGGNLRYIWIGATHMLSGYDHLAFVFGIVFLLTRFKDIVKYITAFTVGHSITLVFATFNAVTVNYFLIDAVIALSVCYIAFHNLDGFKKHLNIKAPNMLAMIFGLGLIHGLGLSTRLQQLPLNPDELLMNIISFNVGIELGQISALVLMLLLISAFRKTHSFAMFSKISNYLLVMTGAFLFFMQMHAYEHATNDELAHKIEAEVLQTKQAHSQQPSWTDTITVMIPAKGEKEYKFQLNKDAKLDYAWQVDKGVLFFDFHGEPKGDTSGYFKSFEVDTSDHTDGSLTTIFAGTHGWYWKNNNDFPVLITLNIAGEYTLINSMADQKKILPLKTVEKTAHDSID